VGGLGRAALGCVGSCLHLYLHLRGVGVRVFDSGGSVACIVHLSRISFDLI
jgi:hypothetical protein